MNGGEILQAPRSGNPSALLVLVVEMAGGNVQHDVFQRPVSCLAALPISFIEAPLGLVFLRPLARCVDVGMQVLMPLE